MNDAPGASSVAGHTMSIPAAASIGSETSTSVNVTLPVFVAVNENTTRSPTVTEPVASEDFTSSTPGFWSPGTSSSSSSSTGSSPGSSAVTAAALSTSPASRSACVTT